MAVSDANLLTRWIQHRDAEAFRLLASRYAAMVYGVCRRILRDPGYAEDAAQECFETLSTLNEAPRAPFAAWLHRVATNRALDKRKAELRRIERESRFAQEAPVECALLPEWDDIHAYVDEAIAALPDHLREPLTACYLRGESHSTIAKSQHMLRRTVSYRIRKGVEEVRDSLRKRGVAVSGSVITAALTSGLAEAAQVSLATSLGRNAIAGVKTSAPGAASIGHSTVLYKLIQAGVHLMLKKATIGVMVLVGLTMGMYYEMNSSDAPDTPETMAQNEAPAIAEITPAEKSPANVTVEEASAAVTAPMSGMFVIPPAVGASISGVVVDTAGKPLAGWKVCAIELLGSLEYGQKNKEECISDEHAGFLLTGMEPGQHRLYTMPAESNESSRSLRNQQTIIELSRDERKTGVKLVYEKGLVISGRVVDEAGNPIHDVGVSLFSDYEVYRKNMQVNPDYIGSDFGHIITGIDGAFEFPELMDTVYALRFAAEGCKHREMDDISPGTIGLTIVLKQGGIHVTGKVIDKKTGEAIPKFKIETSPYGDKRENFINYQRDFQSSGENGIISLDTFSEVEDNQFTLNILAEGYKPVSRIIKAPLDGVVDGVVIEMERGLTLRGRILDTGGNPISGAYIFGSIPPALIKDGNHALAHSGDDGSFAITTLSGDEHIVITAPDDSNGPVMLIVPDTNSAESYMDITLPDRYGEIEGSITIGDNPLPALHASAELMDSDNNRYSVITSIVHTGNKYILPKLMEAPYRVYIDGWLPSSDSSEKGSMFRMAQNTAVYSGKTTRVDFDYTPGACLLEVNVVNPKGDAYVKSVQFVMNNGPLELEWRHASPDADGVYRFYDMPAGDAEVIMQDEGKKYVEHIQIPSSGTVPKEITLGD